MTPLKPAMFLEGKSSLEILPVHTRVSYQLGRYLSGFVFHAGGVGPLSVPGPLACEVGPCDGVKG